MVWVQFPPRCLAGDLRDLWELLVLDASFVPKSGRGAWGAG